MYSRSQDHPAGDPKNYSSNINHPFCQMVTTLIDAGADVLFAAGNCGEGQDVVKYNIDSRCGHGDSGPGHSIHGANSHPDVITVAAMTTDNRRLGYSSQGPGGISQRKPDLAAYSHFKGSGVFSDADGGTSAACPVAAGVVAALCEKISITTVDPYALKAIINRTSIDIDRNGYDYDIGYGVINPKGVISEILASK